MKGMLKSILCLLSVVVCSSLAQADVDEVEIKNIKKRLKTVEKKLADLSDKTTLLAQDVIEGKWTGTFTIVNVYGNIMTRSITAEFAPTSDTGGVWFSSDVSIFGQYLGANFNDTLLGNWQGKYRLVGNNILAHNNLVPPSNNTTSLRNYCRIEPEPNRMLILCRDSGIVELLRDLPG